MSNLSFINENDDENENIKLENQESDQANSDELNENSSEPSYK